MAAIAGYRSAVAVPIMRDGVPVGGIAVTRAQVGSAPGPADRPFEDLADQAVIAIENTRMFEAEQHRTAELSEALDQQTATSEVLKVVFEFTRSSSSLFSRPCLKTRCVSAAPALDVLFPVGQRCLACNGDARGAAGIYLRIGGGGPQRPGPRTALGRVAVTKQARVHITDVTAEPAYIENESYFCGCGKARKVFGQPSYVTMLKDDGLYRCDRHLSP